LLLAFGGILLHAALLTGLAALHLAIAPTTVTAVHVHLGLLPSQPSLLLQRRFWRLELAQPRRLVPCPSGLLALLVLAALVLRVVHLVAGVAGNVQLGGEHIDEVVEVGVVRCEVAVETVVWDANLHGFGIGLRRGRGGIVRCLATGPHGAMLNEDIRVVVWRLAKGWASGQPADVLQILF